MKKYRYAIGLGVLLLFGAALTSQWTHQITAMKGISKLPHFALLSLDSSHILRSEDIPVGRPSVFFYFDPNCEHCQKETEGILQHRRELQNVQFYFLSTATIREIDSFYRYYHLDQQPNVFVGTDYQYSFFNAFLPSTIPYMAIYDKRRALARVCKGEADIDSIINITRNSNYAQK
jgi:hypothetical protein